MVDSDEWISPLPRSSKNACRQLFLYYMLLSLRKFVLCLICFFVASALILQTLIGKSRLREDDSSRCFLVFRYTFASCRAPIRRFYKTSFNSVVIQDKPAPNPREYVVEQAYRVVIPSERVQIRICLFLYGWSLPVRWCRFGCA